MVWLATAVFAVSGLFVLSFILFEVLDIDGSDFPAINLAEYTHDIRRTLGGLNPLHAPYTPPALVIIVNSCFPRDGTLASGSIRPIPLATRGHVLLPRSALPDFLV
jgi:hypothetical protein